MVQRAILKLQKRRITYRTRRLWQYFQLSEAIEAMRFQFLVIPFIPLIIESSYDH